MKKTRFIILGVARSGTTLIQQAIEGHPLVNCVNGDVCDYMVADSGPEIFSYNNVTTSGVDSTWATKCNLDFLFNIIGQNHDVVGFKTAFHSPDVASRFADRVASADRSVKIIATIRKDYLAIEASMQLALKLGRFHAYSGDKNNKRIRLDPVVFSQSVLRYNQIISEIRKMTTTMDVLEISYEDEILPGDFSFYPRICEFLKLNEVVPTWLKMKKQAKAPEEYVENYKELRRIEEHTIRTQTALPLTVPYKIRRKIKWLGAGFLKRRR